MASAYDALGNVIASSSPVAFTVANNWPCSWAPAITVTTGTALGSVWSGKVSVSGTLSGSHAGSDTFQWNWFIDGIPLEQMINTSATNSVSLDTSQFANGPHVVALVTQDQGNSCTTYSDGYEGAATEWSRTVTFNNISTVMEVRENAHEVFLAPAATFTLSPTLVNSDGTTGSPTFDFLSQNTAVATVSTTTGTSSVVTAVANGNAQILTMAEVTTGTDLVTVGSPPTSTVASSSHPFTYRNAGELLRVTGGTGWITGLYIITSVDGNGTAYLNAIAETTGSSRGTFAVGPTRTTWIFVANSNILPHFGTDGSILTAYNPSKSFFMNEAFNSIDGFGDQPYNDDLLGFGDDINASGYNTIELGVTNQDMSQSSQTNFQNGQTSYLNGYLAAIAPWPKFRFFGTGDNLSSSQFYYTTRGPGASWTPPAVQYIFQGLKNAGNFIGVSWHDEINGPWGPNPLQGPIQFVSSPTVQSGLTSITSNGSTCTGHWTGWAFAGSGTFIIHGATTANFNNAMGANYTRNTVDANTFTFSCSVASGTYNLATDPGLTIEPNFYGWTGSDYIHYDAWAQMMTWASAIAGHTQVSGSNAAGTTLQSIANWSGNGIQSIGSVNQVGNWADLYWSHNGENYLVSRASSFALITDSLPISAGIEEGYFTRLRYGSFNPALPITVQTQGTSANYGFEGYPVNIASISNNVITFTAPHKSSVVIPGVTRLWITGSSNSAYNTNFNVNSVLSPTSISVSLAASDFSGTATGGTITFQNGDTKGLTSITASGSRQAYGDTATYTGSSDNSVQRHRGQTFTISGSTGAASFNSRTLYMTGENFSVAQDNNGEAVSWFYFRELPAGSSTGGTAFIVADNNLIKGRNGSVELAGGNYAHPGFGFVSVIEAAILRAAGQRLYKFADTVQGYYDHTVTLSNGMLIKAGWTGLFSQGNVTVFQDNSHAGQLFAHPHWENGFSVPMFHAVNLATLLINVNQKYILQPALNSPDYGPVLDCGARAGSYGDILMCVNGTEGPQTRTLSLSPYLQSGQQIVRYMSDPQGITMTILAAGTASDTVTLNPEAAVFYVFPVQFSAELEQPAICVNLADVPNAAAVVVRYHYDLYLLDKPATNAFNCSTGSCTLPVNRNIGPVYYRLIYLDAGSKVLATSDVQTL